MIFIKIYPKRYNKYSKKLRMGSVGTMPTTAHRNEREFIVGSLQLQIRNFLCQSPYFGVYD